MIKKRNCRRCSRPLEYSGYGRPSFYCNPCAIIVDQEKHIERRKIRESPGKLEKLKVKVLKGDEKAMEDYSIITEQVAKIIEKKRNEAHVDTLNSALEEIQYFIRRGYTSLVRASTVDYHRYLKPIFIENNRNGLKVDGEPGVDLLIKTEKDLKRRLEIAMGTDEKEVWQHGQLVNTQVRFDGIDPAVYKNRKYNPKKLKKRRVRLKFKKQLKSKK